MRPIGAAILLIVLALAGPVSAEDDVDSGAVLAQLRSPVPSEAAWGAYRAGKNGVREAIPLLAELLKPAPGRWNEEWRHLRLAVLDALILLDAKVPGEVETDLVIGPKENEFRSRTILLLSSNPKEHSEALLRLFGPPYGPLECSTVAAGNLLWKMRADGFAARLLAGLIVRLEVTVVDPGKEPDSFGGRGETRGSIEWMGPPDGFPPHAHYAFLSEAAPGARLLADGPQPIWYTRREIARSGWCGEEPPPRFHERDDCSFAWLGTLLGEDRRLISFYDEPVRYVTFEDRDDFRATVRAARDDVARPWFELLSRCLGAKLITPAEARRIEPRVTVVIQDGRKDTSTPLPTVPLPDRVYPFEQQGAGGMLGGRKGHRNLRALGGGRATDAAVASGLDWLDRHQDGTGCWDSDHFSGRCLRDLCPGEGKADLDIVNTSLALLAFLGAGESDRFGHHKRAVRAGLDWLLDQQGDDGRFGPGSERLHRYDHALATLAVGEACALTMDPALKESVARAIGFLRAAKPHDDLAATAWEFRALNTALFCELEVAPEEFKALRDRLDHFESADTALEGLADPERIGDWSCGTLLLFQAGGAPWKAWNTNMKETLLPLQVTEGCEKGSWDPAGFDDVGLGRVGITACLVACLEAYYRYGKCF